MELPLLELALSVRRSTGTLVPFFRDQLFLSIYDSCKHRKTAVYDAGAITDTVISKAIKKVNEHGVMQLNDVKKIAYATLMQFDRDAAVQYRAYYFPEKS